MNGKEELLGHDLDGARVVYWSETNFHTQERQHYIVGGTFQLRLHHIEPGFLGMLKACLNKNRLAA